jgi:hypothetical protein
VIKDHGGSLHGFPLDDVALQLNPYLAGYVFPLPFGSQRSLTPPFLYPHA